MFPWNACRAKIPSISCQRILRCFPGVPCLGQLRVYYTLPRFATCSELRSELFLVDPSGAGIPPSTRRTPSTTGGCTGQCVHVRSWTQLDMEHSIAGSECVTSPRYRIRATGRLWYLPRHLGRYGIPEFEVDWYRSKWGADTGRHGSPLRARSPHESSLKPTQTCQAESPASIARCRDPPQERS